MEHLNDLTFLGTWQEDDDYSPIVLDLNDHQPTQLPNPTTTNTNTRYTIILEIILQKGHGQLYKSIVYNRENDWDQTFAQENINIQV